MAFRPQDLPPKEVPPMMVTKAYRLYLEGQERLDHDDYEGALGLYQKAAALDPNGQEYLSAYGCLLAEVNKAEEAINVLQTGVQRFPEEGFEKYMYLGQLLEGEAAVQSTQKGLAVLQQQIAREADAEEAAELRSQLASGLCSLAEMHMQSSDRDIQEIGQHCEEVLRQAQQADAKSPEPLQVLASLRSEQGRLEEALQLLRESLALWFRPSKEATHLEDGYREDGRAEAHSEEEAMDTGEDIARPSFEFRFECAKLLIQLDETTDTALEILEDLLQENDQSVHLYFLLAMAHFAGGDKETALEFITEGEELMSRLGVPGGDAAAKGFQTLKEKIQASHLKENGTSV